MERQDLLSAMVNAITDAMAVLDERGALLYTNDALRNTWTGDFRDVATLVEALGPDAAVFGKEIQSVLRGERDDASASFFHTREDGTRHWHEGSIRRLPPGFVVQVRDVNDLHQARRAAKEAERRLEHFVKQAPLGVIEWNIRFECTAWSPTAEKIFGFTAAEAIGRHFTELISYGLVRETIDGYWRELVTRGLPTRNTNENVDKHGNVLLCEWLNLPYFDEDGHFVGVWSLCNDLTERRHSEQAMTEAARALELKAREAAAEAEEKGKLLVELDRKFELIANQTAEIAALSSPVLELWEGVVAVPIIGRLDETRSTQLMEKLLGAIVEKQSHIVLLDVTGLEMLEEGSAERLTSIVQAVELLGARGILTGVQPAVARTIVEIGRTFGAATTCRSLRDGLRLALGMDPRSSGKAQSRRSL